MSTMFRWLEREELILKNPCQLGRHELPKKVDKDPTWRANAVFLREEAEALIHCPDVPADRRVFYAILFLCGPRPREVIPLRWSDLVRRAPLDGLQFARAYNTKEKKLKARTKTGATKVVPVHPVLADILEGWWSDGWERRYGRSPREADLIVPMPLDPSRGRRKGGPDTMWSGDAFRKRAKGDASQRRACSPRRLRRRRCL